MIKYPLKKNQIYSWSQTLLFLFFLSTLNAQTHQDCLNNTTHVGGQVYLDYNDNADWEDTGNFSEDGAEGVTVLAYDKDGIMLGTATTDAAGGWSIAVGNGEAVRIEFELPKHFALAKGGTASKTNVAFATAPQCDINLGVHDPNEYCETDPEVITICHTEDWTSGSTPVLISIDYSDGDNSATDISGYIDHNHPVAVPKSETGNIWGLAYSQKNDLIYTSSSFKPGVDLSANLGNIYYVDNSTNTGTTGDVSTADVVTTVDAGSDPTDGEPDDGLPGGEDFDAAFDGAGKLGIGGIDLNANEDTLWLINLYNSKLVGIPLSANGKYKDGSKVEFSMPSPASCTGESIRPFAVKWYRGKVYVGMVCSGEITQDVNKLRAYVYTYTPGESGLSTTAVLDFPLNYTRGTATSAVSANWNPWKTIWNAANPMSGIHVNSSFQGAYPCPMFSDIAFDKGDMILGITDRFGDQFGSGEDPAGMIAGNPSNNNEINMVPGGELLKAGYNGNNSWTIESNGDVVSASRGTYSSSGTVTNTGPGGKEFYHDERYSSHKEVALGGISNLPGRHEIISGAYDPTILHREGTGDSRWGSGGLVWYNNNDGTQSKAWEGYYSGQPDQNVPGNFGKGNGFGDVETMCLDQAALQIGNRIWSDDNDNGIQDADEDGLAGVTVQLYSAAEVLLATTISDADGSYFFSKDGDAGQTWVTTDDQVSEATTYILVYGAAQFAAGKLDMGVSGEYFLSNPNMTSSSNLPDRVDSDATVGGLTDPVVAMDMPFVTFMTGAAGENMQLFDVGFFLDIVSLPIELININLVENDCKAQLIWTVGAEKNFDHFEIQTSTNGLDFTQEEVQSISEDKSIYTSNAVALSGAAKYFRLKMVDEDGSYSYSKTLSSQAQCLDDVNVTLFPNPSSADRGVNVAIENGKGNGQLIILDNFGRTLSIQQIQLNGIAQFELPVNNLQAGIYHLVYENQFGEKNHQKFILMR